MKLKPLAVDDLYRRCDPAALLFQTTADVEDLREVIGQSRALEAIQFGVGVRREGYNLYVMGPPGVGKHAIVRRVLEQRAAGAPGPADWVYVNNFAQPHQPLALELPAGGGEGLRQDLERLLEDLQDALPAAFDSDEYRARVREIQGEFSRREQEAQRGVQAMGEPQGVILLRTPSGYAMIPGKDGQMLGPDEFNTLPPAERERLERAVAALDEEMQKILRQIPHWRREQRERIRQLNEEVAMSAVGHLMDELRRRYAALPRVLAHLEAVQRDILDNVDDFLGKEEESAPPLPTPQGAPGLLRYQVNVLVSHDQESGAPVLYEDNPGFQDLIGRVEYMAQYGALVTNFTLIRPGALHRANGGYLLLDVRDLFTQPYAWEALKRVLFAREIRIVSLGEMFSLISTVSLEPQPIPLRLTVVLLGERLFYYLLYQLDPDFRELFKVAADMAEEIDRSDDSHGLYARLIATLARKESLRPLDRGAVARVIEHSARMAEDAGKLSIHMQTVTDLLQEADYCAGDSPVIEAVHVRQAIAARRRRSARMHEQLLEAIRREVVLIDTRGEQVGQINGLSVMDLGDACWGQPARITAAVRLGGGEVVDIEREADLGGPIHSKGVLILSSFLGARYARQFPLSLRASLTFEQSYGKVEGDSASLAELCALLSALGEIPIRQFLAVTGSVNQRGQVQAVGGVNDKIEGFFDVCQARGGPEGQGVIIPLANVRHLMLGEEALAAVAAGRFQVYAVSTVDEAMALLTGLEPGERNEQGEFPEGSVNRRVEDRLIELSRLRQAFAKEADLEADSGSAGPAPFP